MGKCHARLSLGLTCQNFIANHQKGCQAGLGGNTSCTPDGFPTHCRYLYVGSPAKPTVLCGPAAVASI